MFSRAFSQSSLLSHLGVFPRFLAVTCFSALFTGYMFSRAWHQLHVFPCFTLVACFPVLGTGYMFSRAWYRLHIFPRLTPHIFYYEFWLVHCVVCICCDWSGVLTLVQFSRHFVEQSSSQTQLREDSNQLFYLHILHISQMIIRANKLCSLPFKKSPLQFVLCAVAIRNNLYLLT